MDFLSKFYFNYSRIIKTIKIYLLLAGPGLIVMIADNDAGGITTYAATGAKFGYNLIWFLVLLGPVAYFVQEMTVRLGAVTKHGHAEAIFSAFGSFWGWFSLLDLSIVNWLTMVTEFVGMTAALSIFGVSPIITVVIVIFVMLGIVMSGRYWTWEKITMAFCLVNLIYIPAAIIIHPSVSDILRAGIIPNFPGGFNGELFFFLMANIGTTIAPWMIFFQQSAVVDKQMKEKDIPWGKFDTFIGAIFTVIVAIFVIVVTGTLLYGMNIESAAQAAQVIMGVHPLVGTLVAIGLFDAGFLGAICIALTNSWAFGEVFGWAHSLNYKVKEAFWFYVYYFIGLITAGAVVLIPNAPLILITLFVQVVAVTLLPAALIFLIILLNSEEIMGKYKNTLFDNIANISIVVCIIIVSTLFGISTLFPNLFG
ncbi:NRAMP family divalent metal transporter [Methanoregula sp.]|jgi:Mn2+/Fe2+ NRAMP family transporter|uniref:NRAMP family divalent metal transporter n=1 Tax=Methanoregula sp. TaxID=2052170 RepID=UPI0025CBF4CA|nr:divalent metal cation transporter [Methanoregula sp.]